MEGTGYTNWGRFIVSIRKSSNSGTNTGTRRFESGGIITTAYTSSTGRPTGSRATGTTTFGPIAVFTASSSSATSPRGSANNNQGSSSTCEHHHRYASTASTRIGLIGASERLATVWSKGTSHSSISIQSFCLPIGGVIYNIHDNSKSANFFIHCKATGR
ncbi:hypothetical protein BGZ83_000539 [Gryganskiella cystojenkinii]|nr:hypothetical protein BGZ83_000539 [Gryganskiella cystojenkinii]